MTLVYIVYVLLLKDVCRVLALTFVCLFVNVLGWCPLMRRVRAAYLLGGQMGVIIPFPNMYLLQERNPEPTSRQKSPDVDTHGPVRHPCSGHLPIDIYSCP